MDSMNRVWVINKSNGVVSIWSPGMDCVFGVTHDKIDEKTARGIMDRKVSWKSYVPLDDKSEGAVAEANSKANAEAALSPKGSPSAQELLELFARVSVENVSEGDADRVPDGQLIHFASKCLGVDLGDMAASSGPGSLRPKINAIIRRLVASRAEKAAAEKARADELEARRRSIEKKTGVKTVIEHRK